MYPQETLTRSTVATPENHTFEAISSTINAIVSYSIFEWINLADYKNICNLKINIAQINETENKKMTFAFEKLKKIVPSLTKILNSFQKEYISCMLNIPSKSDLLLSNDWEDSRESIQLKISEFTERLNIATTIWQIVSTFEKQQRISHPNPFIRLISWDFNDLKSNCTVPTVAKNSHYR